jgi:hypothetical protein
MRRCATRLICKYRRLQKVFQPTFNLNLRALPFPTQTATAQQLLSSGIGVGPGEHVGVFMEWENWCQPFPEGGVELRLVFSDSLGFVKGPTNAYVGGPCRFSNDSSQIWVSQYFHTP